MSPSHIQTCFATNHDVAGCERLFKKVESSSTFCNKIITCYAFYRPKANSVCSKWRNLRVWLHSRVILSSQRSVFTQPAATWFFARQILTWVVERATRFATILRSSKQVARFCPPFYRSFKGRITVASCPNFNLPFSCTGIRVTRASQPCNHPIPSVL